MALSAEEDEEEEEEGGEGEDGDGGDGGEDSFWPMKSSSFDLAMDRIAAPFTSSVWVILELYRGDMGEWRGMRSMLKPIRVLLASTNNTLQNEKINVVTTKGCIMSANWKRKMIDRARKWEMDGGEEYLVVLLFIVFELYLSRKLFLFRSDKIVL